VVESLPTYVSIADAQPSTLTAPDTSGMDLSGPNVGFLEDEYGLSQAQAEAATVTSEVVGSLAEQVAARYPSSYAGSWLDYGSTTVGTVAVASSTVAATLQAELATALQPTIDIVTVPLSAEQLESDFDELVDAISADHSGGPMEQTVAWIDEVENELHVDTRQGSTEAANVQDGVAAATIAAPVTVTENPTDQTLESLDCWDQSNDGGATAQRVCTEPLRGGMYLVVHGDGPVPGACTLGFTARQNRQYRVLTAGHCVNGTTTAGCVCGHVNSTVDDGNGRRIGHVLSFHYQNGTRYDWASISVRAARRFWHPNNLIVRNNGDEDYRITDVERNVSSVPIGRVYCHAGEASWQNNVPERCGQLKSKRVTVPDGGPTHVGAVYTRACHGDSGAPFFWFGTHHQAVGILSSRAGRACSNLDSRTSIFFSWIGDVEAAAHVTVLSSLQRFGGS
jgi:hypothetical protein